MGPIQGPESYSWGHKLSQWFLEARPKVANHSLASTAGFCFGVPWLPYRAQKVMHGATSLTHACWNPGFSLSIILRQALLASALVPHGFQVVAAKVVHRATSLTNGCCQPGLRLPIIFWQALLPDVLVPHGLHTGPTKLAMGPPA